MIRVLILLLVTAAPALADPTPDEVARAHYVSAQAYFKQGRAGDALREFEEAYRISPRPAFHYNIAICHEKLGNTAEAIAAYQRYLSESPDAADREAVEAHVAQLRLLQPPQPAVAPAPTPSPEPAAAPIVVQPRSAPVDKPSRAWIWGVAGGGVALVTVAIIIGVVVGTSGNSMQTLPGVTLR